MSSQEKFCSGCASVLEFRDVEGRRRPVCPNCGRVVYHDPKIAATCIVERQGKVLLIQRNNQVGYGLWSMPGGYVDRGEVVEEAAAREVQEETGLQVEIQRLVGLFSEEGHPVVVAAFTARETGGRLAAGPEAQDIGFFALDDLPEMAFPRDQLILEKWLGMQELGRAD